MFSGSAHMGAAYIGVDVILRFLTCFATTVCHMFFEGQPVVNHDAQVFQAWARCNCGISNYDSSLLNFLSATDQNCLSHVRCQGESLRIEPCACFVADSFCIRKVFGNLTISAGQAKK